MTADFELKVSVANYHRTEPLLNGEVRFEGMKPSFHAAVPGEACMRPVYEEYDVAEMSLSWYIMARSRGEPVWALPIFPLRMFMQPYIFCSADSNIADPEDLIGKRVGMQQYRLTVGLWIRGILQEHYGVFQENIDWVTGDSEGAGYTIPPQVKVTQVDENLEQLLLDGKLDALIVPNIPKSFRAGDKRIRRLFPHCREAVKEYFDKTNIFPITHTVVVGEKLLEKEPWVAEKVIKAFRDATLHCAKKYEYPKRLSYPTAVLILEEEESAFGPDPWEDRLEVNEHVLNKFIEYAVPQGYIPKKMALDELFWSRPSA